MSNAIEKPTKEEMIKVRSRLIFLRDKSNLLVLPSILAYIATFITLAIFNQTQNIPTIVALAFLHGLTSIDGLSSLKDEYEAIKTEETKEIKNRKIEKGVKNV